MKKFQEYLFFIVLFSACFLANAQTTIYQIDIEKEIGSTTWRYLRTGLHKAQKQQAEAVLLRLNTYGGTVVHADSMRTAILNAPIPVYAFIDNNAASAGALIAIACDSIYMRSSASMGAATVVNETGAAMPDKYQSYMRATMRATAEAHGKDSTGNWRRNPLIAEAMVGQNARVTYETVDFHNAAYDRPVTYRMNADMVMAKAMAAEAAPALPVFEPGMTTLSRNLTAKVRILPKAKARVKAPKPDNDRPRPMHPIANVN